MLLSGLVYLGLAIGSIGLALGIGYAIYQVVEIIRDN